MGRKTSCLLNQCLLLQDLLGWSAFWFGFGGVLNEEQCFLAGVFSYSVWADVFRLVVCGWVFVDQCIWVSVSMLVFCVCIYGPVFLVWCLG